MSLGPHRRRKDVIATESASCLLAVLGLEAGGVKERSLRLAGLIHRWWEATWKVRAPAPLPRRARLLAKALVVFGRRRPPYPPYARPVLWHHRDDRTLAVGVVLSPCARGSRRRGGRVKARRAQPLSRHRVGPSCARPLGQLSERRDSGAAASRGTAGLASGGGTGRGEVPPACRLELGRETAAAPRVRPQSPRDASPDGEQQDGRGE